MAHDRRQYFTGIDIGSTTVKLVVLSDDGRTEFADYCRHHARIRETLRRLLKKVEEELGDIRSTMIEKFVIWEMAAKMIATCLVFTWNYLIRTRVIYRKKSKLTSKE